MSERYCARCDYIANSIDTHCPLCGGALVYDDPLDVQEGEEDDESIPG